MGGNGQPGSRELCQCMASGVLLAQQVAGDAAIKAQIQINQMLAHDLCLAHTQGRQHVVVVGAKRGLAMSYQVDAAHFRVIPLG